MLGKAIKFVEEQLDEIDGHHPSGVSQFLFAILMAAGFIALCLIGGVFP